jgi:hypothetical protein
MGTISIKSEEVDIDQPDHSSDCVKSGNDSSNPNSYRRNKLPIRRKLTQIGYGKSSPDVGKFALISAKVGDGLDIGREAFDELHQLDVAVRFPFQLMARTNTIEIAVEIGLEEIARMVRRSTSSLNVIHCRSV